MKAIFEWYGYNVEVEYEVTDDSIDILFWGFESDEILDELNLYNDHAKTEFEAELVQMVAEYESQQRRDMKRLRDYLKTKDRKYNG